MDDDPNIPGEVGVLIGCVIRVTHIKFNFDPTAHSSDALNIRLNRTHEVEVPEWKQGAFLPEHSKAAYAIQPTRNQTIFIQCRFEIVPAFSRQTGTVRATGGGILGAIDPVIVEFVNGVSRDTSHGGDPEYVRIPLTHCRLQAISRRDIQWDWSYQCSGTQTWQQMDQPTRHRIYVVLDVPPSPWSQVDPQIYPWTTALDYAIVSANTNSINDPHEAAALIVQRVNGEPLQYDILRGSPSYFSGFTGGTFLIDHWLGGFTAGSIVNCYDCAGAVTTFSNVLGCQLTYQYHNRFGFLNPVYPIGRGLCNHPFYGGWPPINVPLAGVDDAQRSYFGNHAYGKQMGSNYDACMRASLSSLTAGRYFAWAVLVWVFTFGFGASAARRLMMKGYGWLIQASQPEYNAIVVDTSTPGEAARNGGVPGSYVITI